MNKIEVPTDSVPEFELGDTATDIQWRRKESGAIERAEAQKQREEEARKEAEASAEETHSQEEEVAKKGPEPRDVTQKQSLKERPHSPNTRKGTFSCLTDLHEGP